MLFAFSHLWFRHASDELADGYARLHADATDLPGALENLRAID